jgi:hypothetical protein
MAERHSSTRWYVVVDGACVSRNAETGIGYTSYSHVIFSSSLMSKIASLFSIHLEDVSSLRATSLSI